MGCRAWPHCPVKSDGSGGPISGANLGAFHDRRHYDKTHHGFKVIQPSSGEFVIISPADFTYHVDPEAVGPITDPRPDESGCDPPDQ